MLIVALPACPATLDARFRRADILAGCRPSRNGPATTFSTSGTTGVPKGVVFSHRQLVLQTLTAIAARGSPRTQGRFHREDVYMPPAQMFHVHAWGAPYLATTMGVKQVIPAALRAGSTARTHPH